MSFTDLRGLLVLLARGVLAKLTSAADWQRCSSLRGPAGRTYLLVVIGASSI